MDRSQRPALQLDVPATREQGPGPREEGPEPFHLVHGKVRPFPLVSAKSPPSSKTEARAHERVALEMEVSFATETHFFTGLSRDVSSGGIFVATYRPLRVGTRVSLSIALPDGPLNASGVVRWTRDASEGSTPGFGVSFEGLSGEVLARVERFCAARPPFLYEVE